MLLLPLLDFHSAVAVQVNLYQPVVCTHCAHTFILTHKLLRRPMVDGQIDVNGVSESALLLHDTIPDSSATTTSNDEIYKFSFSEYLRVPEWTACTLLLDIRISTKWLFCWSSKRNSVRCPPLSFYQDSTSNSNSSSNSAGKPCLTFLLFETLLLLPLLAPASIL